MPKRNRLRKAGRIAGAIVALLLVLGAVALWFLNPSLTRYIESDAFRAELEKQTAKGLHFPASKYAGVRRTGLLSATADSFAADDGEKAMTKIDAHRITARFNPLAVFLRRWQIDDLQIDRGEVGIQTYEPQPTPTPAKPWYHPILPQRVYLRRVTADPADITWKMQGKKGGIFDTRLVITPRGRDFNYEATGGTLRNPLVPEVALRETYLTVTKEIFRLHSLVLASGDGLIFAKGEAETRDDKAIDFEIKWDRLPLRAWLPEKWPGAYRGTAEGELRWTGRDFKLETTKIEGHIRLHAAQLSGVAFLEKIAVITRRDDLRQLTLDQASAHFTMDQGNGELRDLALEDKGKFRVEGRITFSKSSLGGALQLGVAPVYLEWLPNFEEVFPRADGGYRWTTVRLSGSPDNPGQDLSPRILDALDDNPFAFLATGLRALGVWLKGD